MQLQYFINIDKVKWIYSKTLQCKKNRNYRGKFESYGEAKLTLYEIQFILKIICILLHIKILTEIWKIADDKMIDIGYNRFFWRHYCCCCLYSLCCCSCWCSWCCVVVYRFTRYLSERYVFSLMIAALNFAWNENETF